MEMKNVTDDLFTSDRCVKIVIATKAFRVDVGVPHTCVCFYLKKRF